MRGWSTSSGLPLLLAALLVALLPACGEDRRGGGGGGGGGGGEGEGEGEDVPPGCEGVSCPEHQRCKTAGGNPVCVCEEGWTRVDGICRAEDPCSQTDCGGHGTCEERGGAAWCDCDEGWKPQGDTCLNEESPCEGVECSGHGSCRNWGEHDGGVICACNPGYTPSNRFGLDCVATETVCVGGPIHYDIDDDGQVETYLEPTEWECRMFELVNRTRATHLTEGAPECRFPLTWNSEWAAHGRNHSKKMNERGELYHDDVSAGQNCAYGCDPACEMNLYMTGPDEPHCPAQSHHCNIMSCSFSQIGIGYWATTWNTQNFVR